MIPQGISIKDYFRDKAIRKTKREAKAVFLWGRYKKTKQDAPGASPASFRENGPKRAYNLSSVTGWPQKKASTNPRTLLYKQLDHLCKLIVIRRDSKKYAGYCLMCVVKRELGFTREMPRPITTPYHVLPRGDKAVRWDLRNIIGTCSPCNKGELESRSKASLRARYRAMHAIILGEEVLQELEALARTTVQLSIPMLIQLRENFKAILQGNGAYENNKSVGKIQPI